ncbi:minor capsid protein [Paenibacillus lutimineralis]|uniref:DUF3168 domain-containing protein n=1 Tax=Paenibacillus lutimineralis TaxID=2707005 RepID=A0A3S9V4C4_9BACL|nr:minor capsid protein [Paenibacillus lutimineralis]AZS17392.1 hypothetical protein EI981_25205 [Paenibacillus lutimineralis]
MFKPKQFADFLLQSIPYKYYANDFPPDSPDEAAWVRLTGGYAPSEWSPRKLPSVQIVVRGHQSKAVQTEEIADQIYKFLHQKREFHVASHLVRFCKADQSSPIYAGRDDNGRVIYSLNFTLVVME